MVHLWWEESLWPKLTATASHLKLGASFANLVNVGQRASVVRRPRLGQAELLDLLKLHLPSKEKPLTDSEIINPTQIFAQELTSGASYVSFHVSAGEVCVTRGVCETRGVPTWTACTHTRWLTGLFHMQVTNRSPQRLILSDWRVWTHRAMRPTSLCPIRHHSRPCLAS